MCGICGIFDVQHRLGPIVRMNKVQAHRGPDDEGYLFIETGTRECRLTAGEDTAGDLALPSCAEVDTSCCTLVLGSRRLAILDLSPAGHMPMSYANGRCWVVFNGEIYNYRELRQQLQALGYTFRSDSDTEVILAAYLEWGVDCLSRFNGMFGIALWDSESNVLFCARDRFGVKPFYYHQQDGFFAFASEIKALVEHPAVPRTPHDETIYDYLALGLSDHSAQTFFEGIVALPPGHFALLDLTDGTLRRQRWWNVEVNDSFEPQSARHSERVYAEFANLLEDAVRLRLRSDVPVGSALSGGLDSSSIVVLANRLLLEEQVIPRHLVGEHQQTFTARNIEADIDEHFYSNLIVQRTGAQEHLVYPKPQTLWRELAQFVWHQDEPVNSTSQYAQWCVMRLAKQNGVTVLLDGQGGDEILAGYTAYVPLYVEQVRQYAGLGAAAKAAWQTARIGGGPVVNTLIDHAKHRLPPRAQQLVDVLHPPRLGPGHGGTGLQEWQLAPALMEQCHARRWTAPQLGNGGLAGHLHRDLTATNLPKLLRYEDRSSMAFSLETRLPFLDYRLVQMVFSLPLNYRFHDGWSKYLLRRAMNDKLPPEIAWRKTKLGYPTPEVNWLRAGSDTIRQVLRDNVANPLLAQYVRPDALREMAALPDDALAEAPGLWRIVNLAVWLDLHFGARRQTSSLRAELTPAIS
jgi:asparagine synthase (glutamine-hydrolysing)